MRDGSVYEGPGFVPEVESVEVQKTTPMSKQIIVEQPPSLGEKFPSNLSDKKYTLKVSTTKAKPAQSSDYSLYKCSGCGQMVLGFDKDIHIQQMHHGKDPGYLKL